MRVVEIDLSFPYLIYFIAIEMTSFHEFMAICSIVLQVISWILILGHFLPESSEAMKNGKKFLILVSKIGVVTCTILAFIQIFISDGSFDIQEDLVDYGYISKYTSPGVYTWKPTMFPVTPS